MRRPTPIWTYIIFGFAIVGLATTLVFDFSSLINNLLRIALTIGLVYGFVYFFVLRHRQPNDIKKYRKAVKQSKKKYGNNKTSYIKTKKKQSSQQKKRQKPRRNKQRNPHHLKVIDGKKDTHKKMSL